MFRNLVVSPFYHLTSAVDIAGEGSMEHLPSERDALEEDSATNLVAGEEPNVFGIGADGLSVYESSFPARVAAFLRFSPVIEAAQVARRRDWPEATYDIVTLALTAIDLVVARQGFELEATRADVVTPLTDLAYAAAPDRPAAEHQDVAVFVVDALVNRPGRQA